MSVTHKTPQGPSAELHRQTTTTGADTDHPSCPEGISQTVGLPASHKERELQGSRLSELSATLVGMGVVVVVEGRGYFL